MNRFFRPIGAALLDVLYPPRCLVCDDYADSFCDACRARIRPVEENLAPAGLAGVVCVGYHEEALRQAVLNLKFRRERGLARPLAELMAAELRRRMDEWRPDLLIPVPMHWLRVWERGFNHTQALAAEVSRAAGIPALEALRRTRPAPPQVGLHADERRRNLSGVFAMVNAVSVAGRRVVVLDDVRTTGSTLSECAGTLRKAGAAEVFGLTITFEA